MSFDDRDAVARRVREVAIEFAKKGPGYGQAGVVLRDVRNTLKPQNVEDEQVILEAWHALFASGELSWGYDLDNPSSPFFHVTRLSPAETPS